MKKKFDPVAYYKGFTLGYIMVAWLVTVFWLRQSELWLIPEIFIYLVISALTFKSYYFGIAGNMYYFIKRFDKARKYYALAAKLNTINVPALYNYGILLLQEGKAAEALPLFERAQKYNTKLIYEKNIPLAMGSCHWLMGNIDKAIELMEALEEKYSYVNVSTLTTLGYLYILKEDLEKAESYTTRALEDIPEHAPAWDNMGQIYFHKGDMEKAEEYFIKALDYRKDMPDSLYYLGVIARNRGDKEGAKTYLARALTCNITALNTVTSEEIKRQLKELGE